jgi:hypothetical protein
VKSTAAAMQETSPPPFLSLPRSPNLAAAAQHCSPLRTKSPDFRAFSSPLTNMMNYGDKTNCR